jgi:biopolymer transport protein ExbB
VTVASPRSPNLPHELSVIGMFVSADSVVKVVMIGLLIASVATWSVWFAKTVELWSARRKLTADLAILSSHRSLAEAAANREEMSTVANLCGLAANELKLSSGIAEPSGIKDRVGTKLSEAAVVAARASRTGIGILASVGATAPFVGLFGTVWGIMNSFIGISKSQTTNLAVVAPGIAEALLATAIGLFAAIPAVLFYNQLTRSLASHKAQLSRAAAEVERLVSRDLDRSSGYSSHHMRTTRAAE